MNSLTRLITATREKGASMVEYALLIVLIAIVALVAVNMVGPAVSNSFSSAASGLVQP